MIPVRLALRNFLSHAESDLDFTGIHLACLSGDNGHGKSALLDAITWALWGSARACDNNRGVDQLIRLGSSEMEVDFQFEADGQAYRVIRKRQRPASSRQQGRSDLQLQLSSLDGFIPLTGNSIQDTQRKINQILRMDYDTFINSAFLLQGRANEFTISLPAKRKEVLGRILGLEVYDELAERARAFARERGRDAEEKTRELARIDRELERRPDLVQQLADTRAELAEVEASLKQQDELVAMLRDALAAQESQRRQLARARADRQKAEEELRRLDAEAAMQRQRIATHEAILAQKDDIETGYQRLLTAQQDEIALNDSLQRLMVLQREQVRLERLIEAEKQRLASDERVLAIEVARLAEQVEKVPSWSVALQEVVQALADLRPQEEQTLALGQRAQAARAEAQVLLATTQQLSRDLEELRQRLAAIAQGDDTHCPLCGTELGHEGKTEVEHRYHQEEENKAQQMAQHQQQATAYQTQADQLEREAKALERDVAQQRDDLARRRATLEAALTESAQSAQVFAERESALVEIRSHLAGEAYAVDEQSQLRHVQGQIASLGYDAERHTTIRQEVATLRIFEDQQRQLQIAAGLLAKEQDALAATERSRQTWAAQYEQVSAEVKDLEEQVARQPDVASRLESAQAERDRLAQTQSRYRELLGAIGQQLDELQRLAGERVKIEGTLREASREKEAFDDLAVAFSKRGVQALLIDSALPEIEDEANRLLDRMTGGRMTLHLSTQRPTRSGEQETLDIQIADELGTRDYELFSGGETFRIDFALRVALAKLLAHRAGAPMPTLIIDEGFGTQDASGRERLIEAITAIQSDFQRVLVVTHIDDLRDAFPVRIEVTKTPQGSSVAII